MRLRAASPPSTSWGPSADPPITPKPWGHKQRSATNNAAFTLPNALYFTFTVSFLGTSMAQQTQICSQRTIECKCPFITLSLDNNENKESSWLGLCRLCDFMPHGTFGFQVVHADKVAQHVHDQSRAAVWLHVSKETTCKCNNRRQMPCMHYGNLQYIQ